jgi:hypothetical protein
MCNVAFQNIYTLTLHGNIWIIIIIVEMQTNHTQKAFESDSTVTPPGTVGRATKPSYFHILTALYIIFNMHHWILKTVTLRRD